MIGDAAGGSRTIIAPTGITEATTTIGVTVIGTAATATMLHVGVMAGPAIGIAIGIATTIDSKLPQEKLVDPAGLLGREMSSAGENSPKSASKHSSSMVKMAPSPRSESFCRDQSNHERSEDCCYLYYGT